MMPQDDGQIWEFYFEDRPSKEDVLAAIVRKVEQNKDLPEFAEYHSFMYTNVLHVDWFESDNGGHKTDDLYIQLQQITTEPRKKIKSQVQQVIDQTDHEYWNEHKL